MEEETTPIKEKEKQEGCKTCERVWAIFGVLLALGFLYIAFDLGTGGKLTASLTRKEVTDE